MRDLINVLNRYLIDLEVSLNRSETSELRGRKAGGLRLSLVPGAGAEVEHSLRRRLSLYRGGAWGSLDTGGAGPPVKPGVSAEESVGREGVGGAAEDRLQSSRLLGRPEVVKVYKLLVC